jgi:hypothetical protein
VQLVQDAEYLLVRLVADLATLKTSVNTARKNTPRRLTLLYILWTSSITWDNLETR